jgi:hypothetical protein
MLGLNTEGGRGRGRQQQHAQREAGSRSMTAACSEEGGVEVDDGSVTMAKSSRKRTVVARSKAGVEAAACSRVGEEAMACSKAGSRTAGGSGGMTIYRATEEREREREVKNLLSVMRESVGLKF